MTTSGVDLINLSFGGPQATKQAKNTADINDQLISIQLAAAYLALVQAFCETQDKAAKEDAQQTDDQIAKGQASAQVVASLNQAQSGHATSANQSGDSSNAALGVSAAAK